MNQVLSYCCHQVFLLLFCVMAAGAASAVEIDRFNYDIYRGLVDEDQIEDIYFHAREKIIILDRPGIDIPIRVPSHTLTFVAYGFSSSPLDYSAHLLLSATLPLSQLDNLELVSNTELEFADFNDDGLQDVKIISNDPQRLAVTFAGQPGDAAPIIIPTLDSDGDGYQDVNDAFPYDNTEWLDTDNDNVGNNADTDDDDDGYLDSNDAFPLDGTEWLDTDNDSIGNNADTDDDDDGYLDSNDAFPLDATEWLDTDNDNVGNNTDTDDDDDGYLDSNDAFPLDSSEWLDTDNDNVGNNADTDDDDDGYLDSNDAFPLDATEWLDTDNDSVGNNADMDDDDDGYLDSNDAFPLDSTEWVDTDNDNVGNNADTDDDGDGYPDTSDAFPLDATEWRDTDLDGIGDNTDTDDDEDGYSDQLEIEEGTDPLDANSFPNIVIDVTPPVITIIGDNPLIHIRYGQPAVDLGAMAIDDIDGPVAVSVTTMDFFTAGTYTVTYTATDRAGNVATADRQVTVVEWDHDKPHVTLVGFNPARVAVGTNYQDAGATARVNAIELSVSSSGTVDTTTVGHYVITYTASDAYGNTATATRTVVVHPVPSPASFSTSKIPQTGDSHIFHEFDDGYRQSGLARNFSRNYLTETVFDVSTGLTWQDSPDVAALQFNWQEARDYCLTLELGGITNWRLPSPLELLYLVDFNRHGVAERDPRLDASFVHSFRYDGFSKLPYYYWSNDKDGSSALRVDFRTGYLSQHATTNDNYVRCVSGVNPFMPSLWKYNADSDVVFDVNSKLMWQDTVEVENNLMNWHKAIHYCENLELKGLTDWRLPNVNESHTIRKELSSDPIPAFDYQHENIGFFDPPYWWTSSTYSDSTELEINWLSMDRDFTKAWAIYAYTQTFSGASKLHQLDKDEDHYVRCVRDYRESVAVILEQNWVVVHGNPVAFDGSASYAPDSSVASYRWTDLSESEILSHDASFSKSDFSVGEHVIELRIEDIFGKPTKTQVVLTVTEPPAANAGSDQAITEGGAITFDGGTSSSPYGTVVRYEWFDMSNGGVKLHDGVTFSKSDFLPGTHTIELRITDSQGNIGIDTMTVTINARPIANAGEDIFAKLEQSIWLNGSQSSDLEGPIATYEWREGTQILSNYVSFPISTLSLGTHTIVLTVTDSFGASASDTVLITITEPFFEHEMSVCPVVPVTDDHHFEDSYPAENIGWIGFGYFSVTEIENSFNHARLLDNSVTQYLQMPSQAEWDAMSVQEKGLYLLNSERRARGIRPFEGIDPGIVTVVTNYAEYIRSNNQVIGHLNDGRTPTERLNDDPQIANHAQFGSFSYSESVFATFFSRSSDFVADQAVVAAVYTWIYADKYPLFGKSWGHRDHMLSTGADDNSGLPYKEGVIGFGVDVGDYDPEDVFGGNGYGAVVVINTIDPDDTWDLSNAQSVDTDSAQLCHDVVIDVDETAVDLNELVSLELSPSDLLMTPSSSQQLQLSAIYLDGTSVDITGEAHYLPDQRSIVSIDSGDVVALRPGLTHVTATLNGMTSNRVLVRVGEPTNRNNLTDTYGANYLDYIPDNATLAQYEPKAFSVFTGLVKDRNGLPLEGVTVSIHNALEYGSVTTDVDGRFTFAAEAGNRRLVYRKPGYLTVHRAKYAGSNTWANLEDVVMLEVDTKTTRIELNSGNTQVHTSTIVSDEFGTRSTTLVFDGITTGTITSSTGGSRPLDDFTVRATEYELPASMPAELPKESAFTYCSELQIDGVRDDESVVFNQPVVMYVDNFLGFDVGEIVPIGYYDREAGEWKASDNGVVVTLLDTDSDGLVDGVDYTGDNQPDDIDEDGSTTDEAIGIEDYPVGATYWRGSFNHFTPWDFNFGAEPPVNAQKPDDSEPVIDKEGHDETDCATVNSYVKSKALSFHEDIPITGTSLTLHYSSDRTEGYQHKISIPISDDTLPSSVQEILVKLEIGGNTYEQSFPAEINQHAEFVWDGNDPSGKRVPGAVRGHVSVGYRYNLEYTSTGNAADEARALSDFANAWAQVGANNTAVPGRDDFISWNRQVITLQNTYESQIANGWSISNYHESSVVGSIFKGDGTVIDTEQTSLVLRTGMEVSHYPGDDGDYQKGGSDIDYTITEEGILRDTVTGLEWQYIDTPRKFRTQSEASAYCTNEVEPYGTGWRLPTEKEKIYTIDKASGQHTFAVYQFDAISYWSDATANPDENLIPVVCVRGETINDRYVTELKRNNLDEVVVDSQNGLMWQDDSATTSVTTNWEQSIDYCEALEHAGYADWRLPNINELTYALPNTEFVHQTTLPSGELWYPTVSHRNPYWSSTPNSNDSDQAWAMESAGYSYFGFSKTDQYHVRCVRDDTSAFKLPYRFDKTGKHISTVDTDTGNTLITFTHDMDGLLSTITDQFGNTVIINRDVLTGKALSIESHDGYVTELDIDDNGDLQQVEYDDGSNYQFTYVDSLMTEEIDPNGSLFLHQFDQHGRVLQTSDPEGGAWDFFNDRLSSTSIQYGFTSAENNSYHVQRSILPNNDIEKITTLIDGTQLTAINQADGMKETLSSCGVSTVVDRVIDSKTRQEIPQTITITQPSGLQNVTQITKSYAENGADTTKQTVVRSSNGKTHSVYYDALAGTKEITTAENRNVVLNYDPTTGLLDRMQIPGLFDTTYTYDVRGRQETVVTGTRTTTYFYDDAVSKGNLTSITDPDGRVTSFEYDMLGRVKKVTYPDLYTAENHYDSNGNLTTLVTPSIQPYGFTHNSVDNVAMATTPLNETTQYRYDLDRNLAEIELPSGKLIQNTYVNGLLQSTVTPEDTISYTYECGAKVSSVTEGTETITYSYDGNLLTGYSYGGQLNQSISHTYNNDYWMNTLGYAGKTTSINYDNDGALTGIHGYTISRDTQNGLVTSVSDSTLSQSYSHNGYGETTGVTNQINGLNAYSYTLTYNDLGQIVTKTETLSDNTVNNYVYSYNSKRQLTSVSKNSTVVESYDYDANGNRTLQTNTARGISGQIATYNIADQLDSDGGISYTYDVDGYLSQKTSVAGTTTYQYSSHGRLLSVQTPSSTIEYQHNAMGNRVAKRVDGQVVEKYLWYDKTTLLAIYDGNDNLLQRFEYTVGNTPSSFEQGGQTYYIATDHLGTPRAVTDDTGAVINTWEYDAFGNLLSESNPSFTIPFGFAGGLVDRDTGLIRFGYRDYDPQVGRWTARDPIGFAGGDTNLYGYVFNSPINFTDPTGEAVPAIVYVIGVAVKSVMTAADAVSTLSTVADACASTTDKLLAAGTFALGVVSPFGNVGKAAGKLCFVEGTPVHTIDGLKPIEDIQIGDLVAAKDELTGEVTWKPVVDLFRNQDKSVLNVTLLSTEGRSETLGVTPEHPFWVAGKDWVQAGDLQLGDEIVSLSGNTLVVESIALSSTLADTYNFEVLDYHTYFVGDHGAWVHNACADVPNKADLLRQGKDVHVKDVKEAREILDSMSELRPGPGNIMPGFRDRRNTFRGDLINTKDPTNSKIHDRGKHANQPHFNIDIRDKNGVRHKPAIFIDGQ